MNLENSLNVQLFINSIFKSNTYVLSTHEGQNAWCIDPGDHSPILEWLRDNNKILCGIFLTHTHFDHIYGTNELIENFPNAIIYTSQYGAEGLISEKLNGSLYRDIPFVVKHDLVKTVGEDNRIKLWENIQMEVWETVGHNRDCLSFYTPNVVFTGDALIPGLKVVTKAKYSDKSLAAISIQKIMDRTTESTIIYPGHGSFGERKQCKIIVE